MREKSLSCVQLFVTPWTVVYQAPLSMGFSRQGYWSGLPFPSPGDLPDPGVEPGYPVLQADALQSELLGKPLYLQYNSINLIGKFYGHTFGQLKKIRRSKLINFSQQYYWNENGHLKK